MAGAQVHVFGKTMHARKNQVRSGSKYVILLACSENGTLCVIMLLKLLLSLVPLCLSTLPGVGRVIGETKANLRTFMSLFLSLVIRCEPVSGGVLWHIAEAICQHIWSWYWNFSWNVDKWFLGCHSQEIYLASAMCWCVQPSIYVLLLQQTCKVSE